MKLKIADHHFLLGPYFHREESHVVKGATINVIQVKTKLHWQMRKLIVDVLNSAVPLHGLNNLFQMKQSAT
jgi:hypothetical protein